MDSTSGRAAMKAQGLASPCLLCRGRSAFGCVANLHDSRTAVAEGEVVEALVAPFGLCESCMALPDVQARVAAVLAELKPRLLNMN
jgi:hypothetical protein